jgi:hypothetical protein
MALRSWAAASRRVRAVTTRRVGAALVLGCVSSAVVACDDCTVREVAAATAPGGLHVANITAQKCGGAIGGTAVTVRVRRSGDAAGAVGDGGGVEVFAANRWVNPAIRWESASKLIVEYSDPDGKRYGSSVLNTRREPWDGLTFVLRDNTP